MWIINARGRDFTVQFILDTQLPLPHYSTRIQWLFVNKIFIKSKNHIKADSSKKLPASTVVLRRGNQSSKNTA